MLRIYDFFCETKVLCLVIFVKEILKKLIIKTASFYPDLFLAWQKLEPRKELVFALLIKEN